MDRKDIAKKLAYFIIMDNSDFIKENKDNKQKGNFFSDMYDDFFYLII